MAAAKKFLFDISFDELKDKEAPPAPAVESFTRAELDAAREAGYAEGRERALAEAAAAAAAKSAAALAALTEKLPALVAAEDTRAAEMQRDAIAALRAIIAKALPACAARAPMAEIETLAGACLAEAIDEPRIVLRVANEVYDAVRERIDAIAASSGYSGRIVLLAEENLSWGDARIEWADGGAERRLADQLDQIDAALARIAAPLSPPTPPSPEENDR